VKARGWEDSQLLESGDLEVTAKRNDSRALILRRKRCLRRQLRSSTLLEAWLRPTGGTSEPD
jgi:hypothetical protein